MITKVNPYGHISLTNDYLTQLAARAAEHCYGIAAMGQNPPVRTVQTALRHGRLPEKGVTVQEEDGKLHITLHILVGYGLNIKSITQSITHRMRDEMEQVTGLKVDRVDVYVDGILSL